MKTVIIIALLAISIPIKAQSIKEDIKKLLNYYDGVEDLYIQMESSVYEGEKATTVSSVIRKSEQKYLYHLSDRSMLLNDKYIIMVDKRHHNITYEKWTKAKAKQLISSTQIPDPDDLLKRYESITFKGEKNGLKHYHLYGAKEQMSDVDLFFDTQRGVIKKCIYRYNPQLVSDDIRLEVIFNVINTKPKFSETTFSESQFIQIKGKEATAAEKYKGYSVYNMSPTK